MVPSGPYLEAERAPTSALRLEFRFRRRRPRHDYPDGAWSTIRIDVIHWCSARWGNGPVYQSGGRSSRAIERRCQDPELNWLMFPDDAIGFRHADHALEFKLRWC